MKRLPFGDRFFSLRGQKLRKDPSENGEALRRTEGVVRELLGCIHPLVPGLVIVSCFQILAVFFPAAVSQAPWHCFLFSAEGWSLEGK